MNPQLVELIRLAVSRGANDVEIGRVTGYARSYIAHIRRRNGIASTFKAASSDPERIKTIIEKLQAGQTLQEIGDSIGVTRERIRQLAVKGGMSGKVGQAKRKEIRGHYRDLDLETRLSKREARYQQAYGCSYAEVLSLNAGVSMNHPESRALAYRMWIKNVFSVMKSTTEITFPQWVALWGDKWNERGRGPGYRLSRIDRTKPFTIDNVVCERGDEGMARIRKYRPWSYRVQASS